MSFAWNDGIEGVSLAAEAALSAATGSYGAWDSGLWDTATWGPDLFWTDVSPYVRGAETHRKFGGEVVSWDTGTMSLVLDNTDGRFSPDNLSGPYVTAGVTGVRPWRPWRLKATYAGVTYYLYSGYGQDMTDTWVPGHVDAYVTLPCVDELAALADVDGASGSPIGAGDLSGTRIHRLLDSAGHTGARNIMVGRNTMQATTLSTNVVSEIKLTVDSEGGSFFIDADGTVCFEDQYALMEQTRSNTVQAVFGDGSGSELPCVDVTPENTGGIIKNIAAYTRVGGAQQVSADPTSRALYKDKRQSRTDLVCETDTQALSLATFYVQRFKDPKKRFSQIRIRPRVQPKALFPQVLGRRVRDLIRVVARPMGSPTVTRDCHIAGIHHVITQDDWVTTFDLWDATVYQTYSKSRWDVGTWGSSSSDTTAAAWFF